MTERIDETNFIKVDIPSFQDMCKRIMELEKENEELKADNEFLIRKVEGARFRIDSLRRELEDIKNMSMFEFANKYCNDSELEEAGHQLARSLGVGQ
jgi:FtsZ-binding cell division protein ZapB